MKPLKWGRHTYQVTKVSEFVYLLVGPSGGRYYAREDPHNEGLLLIRRVKGGSGTGPFFSQRFVASGDELRPIHAPKDLPWRQKRSIKAEAEGGSHGEGQGQEEDHQEEGSR